MKHLMTLLALVAVLPLSGLLAEEPPAESKPAVAHPIEITQGYGSAKWGMSVEDFQKAYPQAKMEHDEPEDLWRKTMAYRTFTLDDGSKMLSFTFGRGTLVRVTLSLEEHFPNDYRKNDSWNQSTCADIDRQFSFAKDSGVTVRTQIRDATLPGVAPPRPARVRQLVVGPAPAPVPGSPAPERPALPRLIPPPQAYVVTITLEQHKLLESITAEFKRLTDAAQEKAIQQVISKLAPPM